MPQLIVMASAIGFLYLKLSFFLSLPRSEMRGPLSRLRRLWGKKPSKRTGGVIFLIGLLLLSLTLLVKGNSAVGDEPHYLVIARSLVEDRDLDLANNYQGTGLDPHVSPNSARGKSYPAHGIGLPLLSVPFYILGGRLLGSKEAAGVSFLIVIFASLLAQNVYLTIYDFTGRRSIALLSWAIVLLTSPTLTYAFHIFTEIPAAALAVYVYRKVRSGAIRSSAASLAVGCSIGYLPWLHEKYWMLSAVLFAYYLAQAWPLKGKEKRARLLATIIPLAASVIIFGSAYSYLFGSPLPGGGQHTSGKLSFKALHLAVPGMFLDQEVGLLTYSPFYVFSLLGFAFMLVERKLRAEAIWIILTVGSVAGVNAMNYDAPNPAWPLGYCPPTRFLAATIPFFLIPLSLCVVRLKSIFFRWSLALLLGISTMNSFFLLSHPLYMYSELKGLGKLFELHRVEYLSRYFPSFVKPDSISYQLGGLWAALILIFLIVVVLSERMALSSVKQAESRPTSWERITVLTALAVLFPAVVFASVDGALYRHRPTGAYDYQADVKRGYAEGLGRVTPSSNVFSFNYIGPKSDLGLNFDASVRLDFKAADLSGEVGTQIDDPESESLVARYGESRSHPPGELASIPLRGFPPGYYRVSFRLKGQTEDGYNGPLAALKATSDDKAIVFSEKEILSSALNGRGYRVFDLQFNNFKVKVEGLRLSIYYHGVGSLWVAGGDLSIGLASSEDWFKSPDLFRVRFPATLLPGSTGRNAKDAEAKNGFSRYADGNDDYPGHLVYGPYKVFAPGKYEASFRLRAEAGDGSEKPLATLDVFAPRRNWAYAEKEVWWADIKHRSGYNDLTLSYELPREEMVEFRVYYHGTGKLWVDEVSVAPFWE
jgi:hypothetical protein